MKAALFFCIILPALFKVNAQENLLQKHVNFENKVDSLNRELNGIKTSVSFGLSGNSSNSNELHKINSGISLRYGNFPSDFELTLKTETLLKNGVTDDKISDLFISYDYYPEIGKSENRINHKGFVFVSRYSDAYLGIDEKYELGAGAVFNCWGRSNAAKNLTRTGEKNMAVISGLNENLRDSAWNKIRNMKKYQKEVDNLKQANVLKYSKIRAALLMGIFYEVDKIVFNDSIPSIAGMMPYSKDFNATYQLNWEIRPTMEFTFGENLHLAFKCYFKLPFRNLINKVELGDTTDSRFDCFIDFPMALNYKVDKNMELILEYRFMYDNAPRRTFILLDNSIPYLIKPDQRHHAFALKFAVNF